MVYNHPRINATTFSTTFVTLHDSGLGVAICLIRCSDPFSLALRNLLERLVAIDVVTMKDISLRRLKSESGFIRLRDANKIAEQITFFAAIFF